MKRLCLILARGDHDLTLPAAAAEVALKVVTASLRHFSIDSVWPQ